MSSVTVLCPNGHRVKVSTTPNMSLQAVLETAAAKKGFNSAAQVLHHHNKRIDLSNTIRFSGIPNNATLEMVELSEDQLALLTSNQEVSVCLQTPSGERLVETFPSSASLGFVVGKWKEKLGEPVEGEKPVVVYMRREVVGEDELNATTLKTLGLTQGKGLLRFFYKAPVLLTQQANVYNMKVDRPSPTPELPHIPMRLEPEPVKVDHTTTNVTLQGEKSATDTSEQEVLNQESVNVDPIQSSNQEDCSVMESSSMTETAGSVTVAPDSTQPEPEPEPDAVINHVGPHQAIVYYAAEGTSKYKELDDDFFDLSLDEVKTLYRDLKKEVKKVSEGDMLMTKDMREAQKEGEKLSLLSKYKTGVLRIQFPSRHVVQGQFPPNTTIAEVITWLSPLLSSPSTPCELYTAPPRTTLPPTSTLLDLSLFPAALVHFSSLVTKEGTVQYLSDSALANLSNTAGANSVAGKARREGVRSGAGVAQLGVQGNLPVHRDLQNIPESRPGKRSLDPTEPSTTSGGSKSGQQTGPLPGKVPKWFKTGK